MKIFFVLSLCEFLLGLQNICTVFSHLNKHYKNKVIEANRYVRKITVADHVLTEIEKTLLKTPAVFQ